AQPYGCNKSLPVGRSGLGKAALISEKHRLFLVADTTSLRAAYALSIAFAACLAAMAYSFAFSEGLFAVLAMSQALVVLMPVVGICFFGCTLFSDRELLVWMAFTTLLVLNALINPGNYPSSSETAEFAFVHMIGTVGMLF